MASDYLLKIDGIKGESRPSGSGHDHGWRVTVDRFDADRPTSSATVAHDSEWKYVPVWRIATDEGDVTDGVQMARTPLLPAVQVVREVAGSSAGDVDGDGFDDVIVGVGPGGGHVKSGVEAPGGTAGVSASNNLKQIALAVHNSDAGFVPSDVKGFGGGTPLADGPGGTIQIESFNWGVNQSGGTFHGGVAVAGVDGSGTYDARFVTVSDDGVPAEQVGQDLLDDNADVAGGGPSVLLGDGSVRSVSCSAGGPWGDIL